MGRIAGLIRAGAIGAIVLAASSRAADSEYRYSPSVYALQNGRVVPVTGEPLEKGTVVLRDGMIEAVGANVVTPDEAVVIDCTGLTIYPGLIDARTNLLQPKSDNDSDDDSGRERKAEDKTPTGYSHPLSVVRPERVAAELLELKDADLEKWRAVGFTSALIAPRGKVFLGQSAVINLAGSTAGELLVRPRVALHVDFQTTGNNKYPDSTMGVLAVLRQSLLDAASYRQEFSRFSQLGGRDVRRPEFSSALDALEPVVDGQLPVLFDTPKWLDGLRALSLAKEFGLKPVLVGLRDAYRIVPQLTASGATVILAVNFDKAADATPDATDADRDSLFELRDRRQSPESAALLRKAGVPFALTALGLESPADFPKRVATAIERGLSRDAAIEALTMAPARILGVDSMLGSLSPGKIANVVVTEGELFDKKTKVKYLFIDGRKVELEEKAAGADPNAKIELAGTWSLTVQSPDGDVAVTWQIRGSEGQYSGDAVAMGFTLTFSSIEVEGNSVSLKTDGAAVGMPGEIAFSVVVTGESLSGSVTMPDGETVTISGSRTSGPQKGAAR